jgi:hypothetical protein
MHARVDAHSSRRRGRALQLLARQQRIVTPSVVATTAARLCSLALTLQLRQDARHDAAAAVACRIVRSADCSSHHRVVAACAAAGLLPRRRAAMPPVAMHPAAMHPTATGAAFGSAAVRRRRRRQSPSGAAGVAVSVPHTWTAADTAAAVAVARADISAPSITVRSTVTPSIVPCDTVVSHVLPPRATSCVDTPRDVIRPVGTPRSAATALLPVHVPSVLVPLVLWLGTGPPVHQGRYRRQRRTRGGPAATVLQHHSARHVDRCAKGTAITVDHTRRCRRSRCWQRRWRWRWRRCCCRCRCRSCECWH